MRQRYAILAGALTMLVAAPALAQETTVQNDNYTSFLLVVGDFAAGEEAGVRLVPPCQGDIVAVQVGWWDNFGGFSGPSTQAAIHIYGEDEFPTPGPLLASILSPELSPFTDPAMNEFRFLNPAQTIPLSVPVCQGEAFYVALEFAEDTNVCCSTGSVFMDIDGCTADANVLNESTAGWTDFCTIIGGDLVIRAVVRCTDCAADLVENDAVDVQDLLHVLSSWGTPAGDVGCDNDTTVEDLLAVLSAWGPCP